MSIRAKVIMIIMCVVIVVTMASFFTSLFFTNKNLTDTIEQDLSFMIEAADGHVSTKILLLKTNALHFTDQLLKAGSVGEMQEMMREHIVVCPDCMSHSIFDRNGLIVYYGTPISHEEMLMHNEDIERVYNEGVTIITSPFFCTDTGEFIVHLYTPLGSDKILSLTHSGFMFSNLVSGYKLGNTGNVCMVNKDGTIIADIDKQLVIDQRNYIIEAKADSDAASNDNYQIGRFFQDVLSNDKGIGSYNYKGVEHVCSYRYVTDSIAGWHIIVDSPLNESPQSSVLQGLLLFTLYFLIMGTLMSIILSGFVVKPYKELEILIKDTKNTAAKLEAVISNFSGIIWNVDRNNVITLLNGLHIKKFGLSPASFEGRNLDSATKENKNLKSIIMNVQETIEEGAQDWVYDNNGRVFHAHTMPIIDDNGEVDSVVGVIDDISKITQLKSDLETALKVAQDANRAKSNFLASMSHEMRTPLNAIIGLSELTLGFGELNWESSSNLEKIYNAGMTLLSTVNDILDISKIEAGKLVLIPVEYDVPSILNDAINQSSLFIGEKPISFVLDINEMFPLRLCGDDLRVKQILNNLLSNAFKYTLGGTVELCMDFSHEDTASTDNDTIWIIICVRDTGMGIRNKDIHNLFIDYAQMDSKFNRSIEGTGLGLPITKKILEIMGGSINVESEYGKGSVFTAKFRQKIVDNTVIGAETADSLKKFHYSYQKRRRNDKMVRINMPYARVLVVDDVKTNLDVAKGMLKPYGMQIDCVTSGREAINAIHDEKVKYNAVFMDHMMPVMDGIEATKIIREEIGTEYAKTVPIIALTANAIVGNEEMFLSKGFQAFISKPIEIERLDAVLREWVRDKELEKTFKEINLNVQIPDRRGNFDRRQGNERRIKVSGIDLDMGIKRFGGDKESFLNVLRSYVEDSSHLLELIKGVTRDTLADYATTIHGIKGSSRGICAEELGAKAEALEKAAKDGNFEFVAAYNGAFIEATEKLVGDLQGLIRNMSLANPKPKKDNPDPQVLRKLLAACEKYDIDGIDAAMEDIESCEYSSSYGLVSWLRENIAQSNFVEIKEKLTLDKTVH